MLIYQSFGQEAGMTSYRAAIERLIKEFTGDPAAWRLRSMPKARIEGKGFASAQALETPKLLRSIALAIDEGAKGVAIGNGFDPGLWEARELFGVPVLSWFETLAFHALRIGWRLGVVCSGRSGPPRIVDLAARYGIRDRMADPTALNITVPEIMAAFDDSKQADAIFARATAGVKELERQHVDVAIIASGALDVLFESRAMRAIGDLPLVPGLPVLVRELEAAVALAGFGVPFVSRAGRFRSPPETVRGAVREIDGLG